ncbi:hypothetical protein [Nocardia sp. NPDC051832]|uniref:hypothetical protein n=1 Tax=Nocardia sp. NPDC051832 TaxID=3155673 RepID=UPI00342427D9
MVELEIAPRADEVIRPGWSQWLPPLVVAMPTLAFPFMMWPVSSDVLVRTAAIALPVLVYTIFAVYLISIRTVLTDSGITVHQLGRPWRAWRAHIPWSQVVAIETRRFYGSWRPVIHLDNATVVYAGTPSGLVADRRFDEMLDPLRQRHLAATGQAASDIEVPQLKDRPSMLRQGLIAAGSAGLIATMFGAVNAPNRDQVPEADACALLSAELVAEVLPGAQRKPGYGGSYCDWATSEKRTDSTYVPATKLSVSISDRSVHSAGKSFRRDRLKNSAEHVVKDAPDLSGYFWSAISSGDVEAEAHAVVGGYLVAVVIRPVSGGAAAAEEKVTAVTRAVVTALRRES